LHNGQNVQPHAHERLADGKIHSGGGRAGPVLLQRREDLLHHRFQRRLPLLWRLLARHLKGRILRLLNEVYRADPDGVGATGACRRPLCCPHWPRNLSVYRLVLPLSRGWVGCVGCTIGSRHWHWGRHRLHLTDFKHSRYVYQCWSNSTRGLARSSISTTALPLTSRNAGRCRRRSTPHRATSPAAVPSVATQI
jgi:hypothetical protein